MYLNDHVGLTATRDGVSAAQKARGYAIIAGYLFLHHGDCKGGDEAIHRMAISRGGIKIIVHPPLSPIFRAFCVGDETRPPKDYLVRDRDIVNETSRLVALPRGMSEELRSGTWATVRFAKRAGKPVTIVFPDGSVRNA